MSKDDFKRLCAVERRLGKIIDRVTIEEFPVVKDLPASNLNFSMKGGKPNKKPDKEGRPTKPAKPAASNPSSKTPWGGIKK